MASVPAARATACRGRHGDNLAEVDKLVRQNLPLEIAVTKTWTARRAADQGPVHPMSCDAMETKAGLDTDLIIHMREMAAAGHGTCAVMRWLLEYSSLGASQGRIKTIAYIHEAFHLSLGDAAAAGAWHVFPGGTWSDEECEEFLMPRIHATRSQWMTARS